MQHAVIMAGGAGTRLWPLSRRARPKHFLRFIEGKSLLRLSFERLCTFLPPANINVITSADHLDMVAQELPELPTENLIGEPAVRDTANAVGLSAVLLSQRDPQGVMGIFTADHIIRPIEDFESAIQRAFKVATEHRDALVTIGITPTGPHTGYGYIHRGKMLTDHVYAVEAFQEKPNLATACEYVNSGEYFWNSGMFVWRIETILAQFRQHLPDNYAALRRVSEAPDADKRRALIDEIYPTLYKTSIDYGVMEKAKRVIVCEMTCEWLDVGAWTALEDILGADDAGQVLAHHSVVTLDAKDNIFVGDGDHLIAAIGVKDLVVVHSDNATLICHKNHAQKIKNLVGKLDERHL